MFVPSVKAATDPISEATPMATMLTPDARGVLYRRVGEYAALADLDDALADAGRECGLVPAATTRLVDDDLASLAAADHGKFFRVAELRAWESILGNATATGLRDVAIDEEPADVRALARDKIKDLAKYVKDVYGVGLATISVGTIGLDFAASEDDEPDDF